MFQGYLEGPKVCAFECFDSGPFWLWAVYPAFYRLIHALLSCHFKALRRPFSEINIFNKSTY